MRHVFLGLLLLSALSCAHLSRSPHNTQAGQAGVSSTRRPLTLDEARDRSRQVSQVRYGLFFGIDGKNEEFEGRVVLSFFWKGRNGASDPLFIDFYQGAIQSLVINGVTLAEEERKELYDGARIQLPESKLTRGTNRIEIAFTHPYGKSGVGLHRFVDPEDKRVYLFSQAQPFDANRIFPCFDQPDLKATFELTVEAPQDWAVISNIAEKEVSAFDRKASWQFPTTASFSTYLFALHAGPYEIWKSEVNGIPLRLFARDSLKQYVDPQAWFEILAAGLQFFEERFGIPYPFAKYDQVIVPEFPSGAMENVGAVTFSEDYVFKSKPTAAELKSRADTILHEAAHMWFGNLVTMRWWDGLWLNESFATYAAAWALETIAKDHPTLRSQAWTQSLRETAGRELFSEKLWAYFEDASRNTHPVEMEIPDTQSSETVFDGITYAKGAAVIKQLVALVGEDEFTEGLRRYFEKFAYKTATTSHFLKSIEEASSSPLGDWRKHWLQTPGMNRIQASLQCDPETKKVSSFSLNQFGPPRRHRTQVALLYGDGTPRPEPKRRKGEPAPAQTLAKTMDWVKLSEASTPVKSFVGAPCPDFVITNWDDHDYAVMVLDSASEAYLAKNLARVKSPLVRSQIWASLWHALLWGEAQPSTFSDWFWSQGVQEKDPQLLSSLLQRMSRDSRSGSIARWMPQFSDREALATRLAERARMEIARAPSGSDLQRQWWWVLLQNTRNTAWLESLLAGKTSLPGFKLDQDRRWEVLRSWAQAPGHTPESVSARLESELKRDPSDQGRKQALMVEASVGRMDAKAAVFSKALSQDLNYSELGALASGWSSLRQESLVIPFVERAMASVSNEAQTRPQEEAALFAETFLWAPCDSENLQKLGIFYEAHKKNLPPAVIQSVHRLLDEKERCVRLRSRSAS